MNTTEFFDRQPCGSLHPDPTWQRYFTQPHIPGFAQFELWRGKNVLEIGCGIGTDTLEFYGAGAKVVAIDASPRSIDIARARMPNILWLNANAEDWIPKGPFDLIYSFGVLHHTPHPERILLKARNRLAPGGELRIMLYAKYSLKHFLGTQPEAQAGCPLVKWYSGWEARKLLMSCGFEVESVHKTHIFPWRVEDYVEHKYVKEWVWRWMPDWMFHGLERVMGTHLLIVAVPN